MTSLLLPPPPQLSVSDDFVSFYVEHGDHIDLNNPHENGSLDASSASKSLNVHPAVYPSSSRDVFRIQAIVHADVSRSPEPVKIASYNPTLSAFKRPAATDKERIVNRAASPTIQLVHTLYREAHDANVNNNGDNVSSSQSTQRRLGQKRKLADLDPEDEEESNRYDERRISSPDVSEMVKATLRENRKIFDEILLEELSQLELQEESTATQEAVVVKDLYSDVPEVKTQAQPPQETKTTAETSIEKSKEGKQPAAVVTPGSQGDLIIMAHIQGFIIEAISPDSKLQKHMVVFPTRLIARLHREIAELQSKTDTCILQLCSGDNVYFTRVKSGKTMSRSCRCRRVSDGFCPENDSLCMMYRHASIHDTEYTAIIVKRPGDVYINDAVKYMDAKLSESIDCYAKELFDAIYKDDFHRAFGTKFEEARIIMLDAIKSIITVTPEDRHRLRVIVLTAVIALCNSLQLRMHPFDQLRALLADKAQRLNMTKIIEDVADFQLANGEPFIILRRSDQRFSVALIHKLTDGCRVVASLSALKQLADAEFNNRIRTRELILKDTDKMHQKFMASVSRYMFGAAYCDFMTHPSERQGKKNAQEEQQKQKQEAVVSAVAAPGYVSSVIRGHVAPMLFFSPTR